MFEVVARANIHHQQVINLLKQRNKIQASLVYQQGRISTLEQNLVAHLYALIDADQSVLKPVVIELIEALVYITSQKLTSEYLIASGEKFSDLETLSLLCELLPNAFYKNTLPLAFESTYLENVLYKNSTMLSLLIHFDIAWPVEQLQVLRQSALAEQFNPSLIVACFLFGQSEVSSQELSQGYSHSNFNIVKASLVKGLVDDKSNAEKALFTRFHQAKSNDEKADILSLAGLSGDIRWLEPCTIFCQEYPDYSLSVLSHFQHKIFLTMIIHLMSQAATKQNAYQAWLLITNAELLQIPLLQDSSDHLNYAGKQTLPNVKQAELIRQTLMQEAGERLLAGISFSSNNAAEKLNGLQGQAVQRALLLSHSLQNGMPLYSRQLSSSAFTRYFEQNSQLKSKEVQQGQREQGVSYVA